MTAERTTTECHGCGRKICYPPAKVCTLCVMSGKVTKEERVALEDG